jgi:hypothetical protein
MKTDSILYCTDGTQKVVKPKNKEQFTEKELCTIVGGYTEKIFLDDGKIKIMVINKDGKSDELPINIRATEIFMKAGGKVAVAGDALVCESKLIK